MDGAAVGPAQDGMENIGHAIVASTNVQDAAGLYAHNDKGTGVAGSSHDGTGVRAHSDTGIALQVEGLLHVQGPVVGQVTTNGGESSLQVNSVAATAQSTILLTPLSNPSAFLWIASRAAGTFTIGASQPLSSNLMIQYLIIN